MSESLNIVINIYIDGAKDDVILCLILYACMCLIEQSEIQKDWNGGRAMIIRSFLPVGQGACYMERFYFRDDEEKNIIVMYDCGSSSSLESLKECLRDNLKDDSTIHAVFISHFDEDHVNGLPYLLKEYEVKHLFIPLITEKEAKCYLLSCLCGASFSTEGNFFKSFFNEYPYIRNPFGKHTSVHFVQAYQNEGEPVNFFASNWDIQLIKSGENVFDKMSFPQKSEMPDWQYVPFNYMQDLRYPRLMEELQKEFGKHTTIDDVIKYAANDDSRKKIKNAYTRIPGSINSNSMVLYSGPLDKRCTQVKRELIGYSKGCDCLCYYCRNFALKAGCLYMGDYDASGKDKWERLKESLSDYWGMIGCIQIPHHGSIRSYNEELTSSRNRYYIISAGIKNRFRHPHGYVIKDMILKQVSFSVVTEERESEVIMII